MPPHQISTLESILKQFSLEAYAPARNFDISNWSSALERRRGDLDCLILGRNHEDREPGWEARIALKLLERPLDADFTDTRQQPYHPTMPRGIVESAKLAEVCSQLYIINLFDQNLYKNFEINQKQCLEAIDLDEDEPMLPDVFSTPYDSWTGLSSYTASVTINTGYTDEELQTAFSDWLKRRREWESKEGLDIPFHKKITERQLQRWIDLKILAFIDILIFQKAFKIQLPYHQIGQILFPDQYDVDTSERVRKVVRPEARKALSENMLATLDATARSERNRNEC